jgi:hypothetical protein
MATVTMNGNEYKELLLKPYELETRIEDVTNWLKACVKLEIPEDSYFSWGAGKMPGPRNTPMPSWMRDTMLHEIARQLMCQEVSVLKKLEANGAHRYDLFDTNLSNCSGIDVLPYFGGLEHAWKQAHLDNEADKAAAEAGEQEVEEDEP